MFRGPSKYLSDIFETPRPLSSLRQVFFKSITWKPTYFRKTRYVPPIKVYIYGTPDKLNKTRLSRLEYLCFVRPINIAIIYQRNARDKQRYTCSNFSKKKLTKSRYYLIRDYIVKIVKLDVVTKVYIRLIHNKTWNSIVMFPRKFYDSKIENSEYSEVFHNSIVRFVKINILLTVFRYKIKEPE